ncbi:MAG: hypothetical protein V4549_03300 [Bacteroidota bacterium]
MAKEKTYYLIYDYFTGQNMSVTSSEKVKEKYLTTNPVSSYRVINYPLFLMYKSVIKRNKKNEKSRKNK